MVFLCNPNNPTGAVTGRSEILSVASKFPDVVFVVDEAFADFLPNEEGTSVVRDAAGRRNLVALRSLTKFYAIPGLRLGYLVAHEENVDRMLAWKEPWSVNSLAEAAGCAAIEDVEFSRRSKECVAAWKEEMERAIGQISGLQPLPPSVNFILTRITKDSMNVDTMQKHLLTRGILVRNCANFPGLDARYFRAAVRSPQENVRLLEALREAMGVPIPPYDREDYDRNLAALRQALGENAFAATWADGRATTWEQAVQEAIGAPEEP